MWLTATGILLGTKINFLKPVHINDNFYRATHNSSLQQEYLNHFSGNNSLKERGNSIYLLASTKKNNPVERHLAINTLSISNLTLEQDRNQLNNSPSYSFKEQPIPFKSGEASWKTTTKLGSLTLNGNFNSQAHFTKGRAFWQTDSQLGSVDLDISISDRFKPIKSIATWQTDSILGSIAVKGKFNDETTFTGVEAAWNAKTILGSIAVKGKFNDETTFTEAEAAWNAKTYLGSLVVRGNFDRHTIFTGGNIKVSTKTFIGSIAANVRIDDETKFNGADASWNTNLLFGSYIDVSSKFNENTSFDGGSVKLGAKTALGTMGIKADVDREINFTDVSVDVNFLIP